MRFGDALSELTFPACLLFNRRARRAVLGLVMLRRAYEHVLVMAALGGRAGDSPALLRGVRGRTGDSGRSGFVRSGSSLMRFDDKESVYGR